MHRKFCNNQVEYRNTIDLNHGRPSNMVSKRNQQHMENDLINHLMIDLETIIALIAMPYIVDLNSYELHPRHENSGRSLAKIVEQRAIKNRVQYIHCR
jgi:hypothetical protein